MSSFDRQDDTAGKGSSETPATDDPTEDESSEGLVETKKCPNCGRKFVGNYCPECGQEADTSVSPFDVVSGFFRELVDLERGFWPTFKGLFIRPRTTLKEYLDGARRKMAHPGRYLMAAIVLVYLVEQLLEWSGIRDLYPFPSIRGEIGRTPTLGDLLANWEHIWLVRRQVFYSSQEFQIVAYLLFALLVSLVLFQLLRKRLGWGEALALGAFISGQLILFVAIFVWILDILSLLWYFTFRGLLIENTEVILPLNNWPFLFYSFVSVSYIITLSSHDYRESDQKYWYVLFSKEKEPKYFFDNYVMLGLVLSVFQYIVMAGPVRLLFEDQVLSTGIAWLIVIPLIPSVAIEVYQQVWSAPRELDEAARGRATDSERDLARDRKKSERWWPSPSPLGNLCRILSVACILLFIVLSFSSDLSALLLFGLSGAGVVFSFTGLALDYLSGIREDEAAGE